MADYMKISRLIRKKYVYFKPTDTLFDAAKKLAKAGISEAPVIDSGKYIGMFSISDIARVLVKKNIFGTEMIHDHKCVHNDPISKHMKHITATLGPESDILSAYVVLLHKNSGILPVVDKNKQLVGVLFASDIRKKMAEEMLCCSLKENGRDYKTKNIEQLKEWRGPEIKSSFNKYFEIFKSYINKIIFRRNEKENAVKNKDKEKLEQIKEEGTALDKILHYVQSVEKVTADEVSAKFNIPTKEIEEYAICLEKHGLLKTEYDFLGKMTLKRI